MLETPTVSEIATDTPSVRAFEVSRDARSEDVEAMAARIADGFRRHDRLAVLVRLSGVAPGDPLGITGFEALKGGIRPPEKEARFAIVGPAVAAESMIRTLAPLIPTEARVFHPDAEAAAWAFVGARPKAA